MNEIIMLIKEWLPVIVLGFNAAIFIVIKFNDMKHIEQAVQEIKKSISDLIKENNEQGERISKIEGKCTANHG